jgi:hypothetical protein
LLCAATSADFAFASSSCAASCSVAVIT